MTAFRVLVTGSRDWTDAAVIEKALDDLLAECGSLIVIHGNARGADRIAASWAIRRHIEGFDVTCETHLPHWELYGRRAGPIRNAEMVKSGADLCLAFIKDKSPGATGCARLAEDAYIPVVRDER